MNVKIDTREKFCVISPLEEQLTANMTDELKDLLLSRLETDVKNVVLNLSLVAAIETPVAEMLMNSQQYFYEHLQSFVICEMQPAVEDSLEQAGLLELMNTTPTESEAWDIVQMEEIERELMEGED